MNRIFCFIIFFAAFFLFACSKHQFVFMDSHSFESKNPPFLIKNDSLEITYNFAGGNIPVNITVKNTSDKPIYIDWKKSAAIIDERKYSYWEEISYLNASGATYGWDVYVDGTIIKDERKTYIPPHSYVESTRINLQEVFFEEFQASNSTKIIVPSDEGNIQVKKYDFTQENSPFKFRSILTLSSDESFTTETAFDTEFWVAQIIESPVKELYLDRETLHSMGLSENSIISKRTGFGKTMGTITTLGAVTTLLWLSSNVQE